MTVVLNGKLLIKSSQLISCIIYRITHVLANQTHTCTIDIVGLRIRKAVIGRVVVIYCLSPPTILFQSYYHCPQGERPRHPLFRRIYIYVSPISSSFNVGSGLTLAARLIQSACRRVRGPLREVSCS